MRPRKPIPTMGGDKPAPSIKAEQSKSSMQDLASRLLSCDEKERQTILESSPELSLTPVGFTDYAGRQRVLTPWQRAVEDARSESMATYLRYIESLPNGLERARAQAEEVNHALKEPVDFSVLIEAIRAEKFEDDKLSIETEAALKKFREEVAAYSAKSTTQTLLEAYRHYDEANPTLTYEQQDLVVRELATLAHQVPGFKADELSYHYTELSMFAVKRKQEEFTKLMKTLQDAVTDFPLIKDEAPYYWPTRGKF